MLLTNANIITMDPRFPIAKSVAIHEGKIWSISSEVTKQLDHTHTETIDCGGGTILPGLIDSHIHFAGLAENAIIPDIGPEHVHSIQDIQEILKTAAKETPRGQWILARGYHLFNIKEKRHPTRWDIDKVTTSHPVRLMHSTAYIHVLNSLALKMANITASTAEPPGGVIERDLNTGEPNGILYGMGPYLAKVIPSLNDDLMVHAIKTAGEQLISLGITSIHDPSRANDSKRWNLLAKCRDLNVLMPRIQMILGTEPFLQGQFKTQFIEDDYLKTGGVKIILSEATGELYPAMKELLDMVLQIHKAGRQVVIHAVETHHIDVAADAIEYAINRSPRVNHRHRIEHCSECPPKLANRLASLGIIVVTQPNFIFYNGDRYLKTVKKDILPFLYPFNTLITSGIKVAGSSDCPVVPANPFHGIYSAVTRQTATGNQLIPDEKITILDALKMYTINGAFAGFEEQIKGSITRGKIADLIVVNHDLTKIKPEEIIDLKIEIVILGGKIVYSNRG
jgi:predicted amidohydrolase YtcJ